MSEADVAQMQVSQVEQLKAAFAQCPFQFDDAANLQDALAMPTDAFTLAHRQELASMVSRLSTSGTAVPLGTEKTKAKLQDCLQFASMLTEVQWNDVEAMPDIESKLQLVIKIMLQLGLKNPNEATKKHVMSIV